ncbi:hypothetical protein GOODEAATRI_030277 [Goodea atripinnis]|uniref:Uncharacterized protein n=1 Tax=Goodea atripinnis TaxID=208336 RepID=A0ABV0PSW4_9TELE
MPNLSAEEDVLSLAASASQFRDEEEVQSSQASETSSFSLQSAAGADGLLLPFLSLHQRSWWDPRALSRLSTDGRVLAAMHESVKAGLDCMPAVEPTVASLIVSRDEALCPDV